MVTPANVSAVLVTRGDVDLTEIKASLAQFGELVIWNNSVREDLLVYGRYAAIVETANQVIYVQDDDCVLEPGSLDALVAGYESGKVAANMPERFRPHYPDSCLVGFGAVFDHHLPEVAFNRWGWESFGRLLRGDVDGPTFYRTCDVVFTALTDRKLLDLPYRDLHWAHADNRMWKQPEHASARAAMLGLTRQIRDAA